jgi:hypothetical protein
LEQGLLYQRSFSDPPFRVDEQMLMTQDGLSQFRDFFAPAAKLLSGDESPIFERI